MGDPDSPLPLLYVVPQRSHGAIALELAEGTFGTTHLYRDAGQLDMAFVEPAPDLTIQEYVAALDEIRRRQAFDTLLAVDVTTPVCLEYLTYFGQDFDSSKLPPETARVAFDQTWLRQELRGR